MWSSLLILLLFTCSVTSLRIGSFYISDLNVRKTHNAGAWATIVQVLARYDVAFVSGFAKHKEQNVFIEEKLRGDLEIRTNRSWAARNNSEKIVPGQEFGTFFYRPDKLVAQDEFYHRDHNVFNNPYGILFSSNNTGELKKFGLLRLVISRGDVENELNQLASAFRLAQQKWNVQDIMALGSLDDNCLDLGGNELNKLVLRRNESFTWVIGDDVDTLVSDDQNCALDRMIATGDLMREALDLETARAYKFDEMDNFDSSLEAGDVSDHYPIEVELKAAPTTTTMSTTTNDVSQTPTTASSDSTTTRPTTTTASSAAFIKGSQAVMATIFTCFLL